MKRFFRARRAGAAIEFALCGLAFFIMIFAIIDLGDLALVLGAMTYSTETTARAAALQSSANLAGLGSGSSCLTQAQIVALFNSSLPSLLPQAAASGSGAGAPVVQGSWTPGASIDGTASGMYLTVTARYQWTPPGMLRLTVPLSVSETQMLGSSSGTAAQQCS